MKRSDILTPIGMLLGIGLIVFAISQGNVGLAGFYDLVSVIITVIIQDGRLPMNKKVLRNLSYGVYAVSALGENRMSGCIANSIMQITSSPATLAVSMNHDNYTHECIEKSGMFAVSILSEKTDPNIISQLGFQSSRDVDKFMNVPFITKHNIAVVDDACGYLVCKVIDKMETNTHTVFLGEIIDCDMLNQETPMTYAYYHNIIKGKSPKNAPTYQPEDLDTVDSASSDSSITSSNSSGNGKWVCSICGYVYDGDIPFEELPDTFVCPICKQGKDKFKQR